MILASGNQGHRRTDFAFKQPFALVHLPSKENIHGKAESMTDVMQRKDLLCFGDAWRFIGASQDAHHFTGLAHEKHDACHELGARDNNGHWRGAEIVMFLGLEVLTPR